MSLEEALNRNSDLLVQHNELLSALLAKAGAAPASSGEGDEEGKPKRAPRRTKEQIAADNAAAAGNKDEGDGDAVTYATLRANIAAWLGQYAKEEDKDNPDGSHPEVKARREALKTALGSKKIGASKLTEVEGNDEKVAILHDWLENKAKKADKGFGVGRLAADPETEASGDDDDMGV